MTPNVPPSNNPPPWPQTPGPLMQQGPGPMAPMPPRPPMSAAPPPKKGGIGIGWIVAGAGCLAVPLLSCLVFGVAMVVVSHDKDPDPVPVAPVVPPAVAQNDPFGTGGLGAPSAPTAPAVDPFAQHGPIPDGTRVDVPFSNAQPSRGPADAPVTIVEFADFQCPFCKRATATMAALRAAYPGKIHFVWRNEPLPFHVHAEDAAEAAMEAFQQGGSAKFWQMHDLLYADQEHLSDVDLMHDAAALGLDMHRFRRALRLQTHAMQIAADKSVAHIVGADGTPTFYVNGRKISGAQPLSVFKTAVDQELATAGGTGTGTGNLPSPNAATAFGLGR